MRDVGAGGKALLNIRGLTVEFRTPYGRLQALRGVDLAVDSGLVLGIVGESGCGKTVTGRAVLGLLPATAEIHGSIQFEGHELVGLREREYRRVRGGKIAMIFQDPAAALNPVFTVGDHLWSVLRRHRPHDSRTEAVDRAHELLDEVGLPDPPRLMGRYPHQLSGGMQQRVMIAIALSGAPDLLIADEPTTSLDVTVQAQILDLLLELRRSRGLTVLLITHNMAVVERTCDRVAVLYAGRVAEEAPSSLLLQQPKHPYTQALLAALPTKASRRTPLKVVPGVVPSGYEHVGGCVFATRCPFVMPICRTDAPPLIATSTTQDVACWLYGSDSRETVA